MVLLKSVGLVLTSSLLSDIRLTYLNIFLLLVFDLLKESILKLWRKALFLISLKQIYSMPRKVASWQSLKQLADFVFMIDGAWQAPRTLLQSRFCQGLLHQVLFRLEWLILKLIQICLLADIVGRSDWRTDLHVHHRVYFLKSRNSLVGPVEVAKRLSINTGQWQFGRHKRRLSCCSVIIFHSQ